MDTALTTPIAAAAKTLTGADFDEIVRRHQRRVYRFLFMMLRDADEANNLTQECFLRAYQSLTTFRGESSLETWLLRIAANLVRDGARNRKRSFWKRLLGLGDEEQSAAARVVSPHPSPEQRLLANEEVQAIWRAATNARCCNSCSRAGAFGCDWLRTHASASPANPADRNANDFGPRSAGCGGTGCRQRNAICLRAGCFSGR